MSTWTDHEPRHRGQVIASLLGDMQHCEQRAGLMRSHGLTAAAEAIDQLAQTYRDAAAVLGYDDGMEVRLAT